MKGRWWSILPVLTLAAAPALADESRDFASREAAEAAAAELRAHGAEVEIREVTELRPGTLHSVQLRGFPRWSDAQQAANRLRQRGIDSFVFALPEERGYAIGAGVFSVMANADSRVHEILEAGYREVYILRIPEEVRAFRVIADDPSDAGGAAVGAGQSGGAVLRFGDADADADPARRRMPTRADAGLSGRAASVGIDSAHLQTGWLTASGSDVDSSGYLRIDVDAHLAVARDWDAQASLRLSGWQQGGDPDFRHGEVDYGDVWLRHRGTRHRLTVGAQTVLWGRVDEIPPTDRLSVQDATRFALDPLPERRRAVPALRLEHFSDGGLKTDLLWMPWFRAAELPHRDSIWHPVNRRDGRLVGIEPDPQLAALVTGAAFRDDDDGAGGVGLRLSRDGRGFDYALTVQSARHSLPYYEFDPDAVRFTARHPRTTVVGGDFGFAVGTSTWRFEAAWLSDVPVTTRGDFRMETVRGVDWVAGVEFYPGDAETRVNLQYSAQHRLDTPDIIDRHDIHAINGEVETIFANFRWRARLRFSFGLDERDVFLAPELAWIAHEPHELYLAGYYLDGADNALGGFYDDNDLIALGWRAKF